MRRLITASLTLLPFLTMIQMKANLSPVVEYDTATTASDNRPFTLGYEFNLSTTFDITAFGYFADGLNNNHQVGIWDTNGNLLASATVVASDPVVGHFQYQAISDLVLGPGNYVIGGEYPGNGDPLEINAQGVTSQPGYTWIADEQ